jgi:hypothetical protein
MMYLVPCVGASSNNCLAQVAPASSVEGTSQTELKKLMVQMRSLGKARPGIIRRTAISHPSGQVAYVVSKDEKLYVVVGNHESPGFDDVGSGTLQFSANGRHFAFAARIGARWRYYVDMQPGPEFDSVASHFCFGPNGNTFAYSAERNGKWFVVRETGESDPYQQIEAESFAFSPDGEHFAYRASTGQQFAVVLDGKPQYQYAVPTTGTPIFSPDSHHLAYAAAGPQGEYVVYDGISGPNVNGIGLEGIAIGAGGKLAYAAKFGGTWRMFVGDDPQTGEYDAISAPRFSQDGNHLAYFGHVGGKWHIIVDGSHGDPYDQVDFATLRFSDDGLHVAFAAARNGSWTVVLDNAEHRRYESIGAGSITMSSTARRVAFAAMKHGSWHVVRGLVEGGPHEGLVVAPTLSPDGKCVGYVARDGKSCSLVVNDETGPEVDNVLPGSAIHFVDPRRIEGVVGVESDEFFAISATIPEGLAQ